MSNYKCSESTQSGLAVLRPGHQYVCSHEVILRVDADETRGHPSWPLREVRKSALPMTVKPKEPSRVLGEPGRFRILIPP